jgi:hypothetical protein
MQVTWSTERSRFECVCTYEERSIPKSADFRFEYLAGDKKRPCWYATKPEVAVALLEYCDETARSMVAPFQKAAEELPSELLATAQQIAEVAA